MPPVNLWRVTCSDCSSLTPWPLCGMAVTGFWPVFKHLKTTLDYADNPDKTTAPEYLDEDLYAALRYAENDDKTDRKMFVGGINCSAQNTYAEMIAVQRRFGLRGKVVGYHAFRASVRVRSRRSRRLPLARKPTGTIFGRMWNTACPLQPTQENLKSALCARVYLDPVRFSVKAKHWSVPCG